MAAPRSSEACFQRAGASDGSPQAAARSNQIELEDHRLAEATVAEAKTSIERTTAGVSLEVHRVAADLICERREETWLPQTPPNDVRSPLILS
jgi:hypothetical protein